MSDVRAILYEIKIVGSHLEQIHGMESLIYEIHVPSLRLFFNHTGIYPIHKARYKLAKKLKYFKITFDSATYLKQGLTARIKAEKLAQDLLEINIKKYEKAEKK